MLNNLTIIQHRISININPQLYYPVFISKKFKRYFGNITWSGIYSIHYKGVHYIKHNHKWYRLEKFDGVNYNFIKIRPNLHFNTQKWALNREFRGNKDQLLASKEEQDILNKILKVKYNYCNNCKRQALLCKCPPNTGSSGRVPRGGSNLTSSRFINSILNRTNLQLFGLIILIIIIITIIITIIFYNIPLLTNIPDLYILPQDFILNNNI